MRMRLVASILGLSLTGTILAQEATQPAAAPATDAAAPAETAPPVAPVAAETGPAKPGDAAAGATKAAACGACHGVDGNAADPQYPKIAGQHEKYIARQLALFKNGGRVNPIMIGFATTLSAQDMRDIGAHFAASKVVPGLANDAAIPNTDPVETWIQRGERLYRAGNIANGQPACMSCHGPTGRGNPGSAYPSIAGQHASYTSARLTAFHDGEVWGKDAEANNIMATIAKNLSKDDIEALSTYLEGLHAADVAAEAP